MISPEEKKKVKKRDAGSFLLQRPQFTKTGQHNLQRITFKVQENEYWGEGRGQKKDGEDNT